jgi:hypothetical protein
MRMELRHIVTGTSFTDRSDTTRDFTIENGLLVAKGSGGANVVAWGDTDCFGRWDEGCDSVGGVDEGVERGTHGQAPQCYMRTMRETLRMSCEPETFVTSPLQCWELQPICCFCNCF